MDEKGLKEQLSALKTENARIAQFVSENSTIGFNQVRAMMKAGTTITAQKALQFGAVHTITHKQIPAGAIIEEVLAVN